MQICFFFSTRIHSSVDTLKGKQNVGNFDMIGQWAMFNWYKMAEIVLVFLDHKINSQAKAIGELDKQSGS